jgi:hypothetical protein
VSFSSLACASMLRVPIFDWRASWRLTWSANNSLRYVYAHHLSNTCRKAESVLPGAIPCISSSWSQIHSIREEMYRLKRFDMRSVTQVRWWNVLTLTVEDL